MKNYHQLAKSREKILQKIRAFFNANDFIEVETPIMVKIPGSEPHLTPFETGLIVKEQSTSLYLNTSPELQMKKLLAKGLEKIFNITKVFRNGEIYSKTHNPEFTMLEWYRKNSDYFEIMQDTENLIKSLAGDKIIYQGKTVNLADKWDRKTTNQLFQEYLAIDLLENRDYQTFQKTAQKHSYDINGCTDWDDIFFKLFLNHIEPHLGSEKPIFVYDYPSSQAALARKKTDEPFFAERFELYIANMELCNAFSELIDAKEQRERLIEDQETRKKLNKTVFEIDEEFLESLESISQPCAGNALGIDRLIMLLLDNASIEDVLLFPLTAMINQK